MCREISPTEQNKDIVLQFYGAFDSRNISQALALLAPNFVASWHHRAKTGKLYAKAKSLSP
jgi:ketosteroid isomerase-like protein